MLFNSYEFIFLFLPITFGGFAIIYHRRGGEGAIIWLVLASLFYYAWWNPAYLTFIISSMLVNYVVGRNIGSITSKNKLLRRLLLISGITFNLGLLGYFKYANFLIISFGQITDQNFNLATIILPLAISFFTFQQIAYLVDAYEGAASEFNLSHYMLFVTFFPQLIAGPIVHHSEMMPQFTRDDAMKPRYRNLSIGVTIFSIGLFKKAVLADGVAAYATPVFDAAGNGATLTFFEAWGGALAYTMQLYFDFSGYSDMAIGSARMFGIRLPLNFFSPYKSISIIEFWRRWHMTLSRFLRDYLYIPMGGNRRGNIRRYVNLLTTMTLGGLWHGAGWTFVAWGLLHGFYLIINHAWDWLCRKLGIDRFRTLGTWRFAAWLLTFLAVVVGWVFFRAESFDAAIAVLRGMVGLNGISLPNAITARLDADVASSLAAIGIGSYLGGGMTFLLTYLWICGLCLVALVVPNTAQIMRTYRPVLNQFQGDTEYAVQPFRQMVFRFRWRPNLKWGMGMAITAGLAVLALSNISEFLYFQF